MGLSRTWLAFVARGLFPFGSLGSTTRFALVFEGKEDEEGWPFLPLGLLGKKFSSPPIGQGFLGRILIGPSVQLARRSDFCLPSFGGN